MTENYPKALEWLFSQVPNYQKEGKKAYKPGLGNIKKLCAFFGNPQNSLKTIHIGGTNGKGSTSHMLSSILQEAGYNTGLYSSPHLVKFTERIKVNGKNCDSTFVYRFISELKEPMPQINPSFFEFTTLMAFEYFKQKKTDIAVIEVGLGGRLDATNMLSPIVSAITNVDWDHTDLLGNTLKDITREKAGIIKEKTPVISGEERKELKDILKKIACEKKAPFVDASEIISPKIKLDLEGNYQEKNVKVVLAIVKALQKKGFMITPYNVEKGLENTVKNTGFLGRWQIFSTAPLVIGDTAHNVAGFRSVCNQLNTYEKEKHLVLGFVKEKDLVGILKILPKTAQYYFVRPNIERGRKPETYEEEIKSLGIPHYHLYESLAEGYNEAKRKAGKTGLIFIGGSSFVVGEFLEKNLSK
ncbi:MAG: bifunctional folylpolyglutamate synthase/dihydrofolate synthase [Bergeyella sp.]|nr:bifunctional folylpolyglutamate synthase/dihydrofolate synthase [Bergeyella sp.]